MDYRIAHALDRFALHHDGFEDALRAYVLASEYLFVALVAALVIAAVVRDQPLTRAPGVLAAGAAALALTVAKAISVAVDRPRPFVTHPAIHDFLAHAPDPGMPSDHATAAFAIAVAIVLTRRGIGAAALVAAVVLAVGRVVLGVHYPSDVAAGALVGGLAALLVTAGARRLPPVTPAMLWRGRPWAGPSRPVTVAPGQAGAPPAGPNDNVRITGSPAASDAVEVDRGDDREVAVILGVLDDLAHDPARGLRPLRRRDR